MPTSRPGELFGHPTCLYTLFFTELWERFSFYGMKTLLVLYMLNHFFWSQGRASSLLGWYAALAYGLPIVGGFVADRFLGAKRAVLVGGVLLAIGHFLMVFEPLPFFYTALGFIIAGVGLLKPNVSTQVGSLYKPGDPRRDGGFTIFYMGINVGALIGPLVCDWLRVTYGYHYGFAAAGVGMVVGLIVYLIGQRSLVEYRQDAAEDQPPGRGESAPLPAQRVVRDRVLVLLVVFAFVILFWTAFEQGGNVMLIWADKHTDLRVVGATPLADPLAPPVTASAPSPTGWWQNLAMTSGQTQSFNPLFIITLAPVFALFWIWLDRRGRQPSTPTKMVLGVALVAAAYLVMWPAASFENRSSSAPLVALPAGLDLKPYGATRLMFDAQKHELQMRGVLTDLDRLRLLAETAPADFRAGVESLVEKSAAAARTRRGEKWQVAEVVPTAPRQFRLVGAEAEKIVRWDESTRTFTATDEIKERAKTELLAGAAQSEFKAAVDRIYSQSSQFRVSVWWLVLFYLILTTGELCVSPVGLSLVTKLAPPAYVGACMGGWFLATAVAEKLAQVFGAWWGQMPPAAYFAIFVVMCGVGALLMALLIRPLKKRMHGVQ